MDNTVMLEFDKMRTGLAFNPFGKATFVDQIKGKVNENESITLVFPNRIERIAPSFTQGLFSEWIDRHGVNWVRKNVDVVVRDNELREYVYNSLD